MWHVVSTYLEVLLSSCGCVYGRVFLFVTHTHTRSKFQSQKCVLLSQKRSLIVWVRLINEINLKQTEQALYCTRSEGDQKLHVEQRFFWLVVKNEQKLSLTHVISMDTESAFKKKKKSPLSENISSYTNIL